MQVTVTRVFKKDTDKDGVKLMSKSYGKPYYKVDIQIEGSDEWYSGFANSMSEPAYNIQEGGVYHIAVTEKPKSDGNGTWKNYKLLSPEEQELAELRAFKAQQSGGVVSGAPTPVANNTSFQTAHTESHVTLDDIENSVDKF